MHSVAHLLPTRRYQAAALSLILVLCLLFAQWLGLSHALSHVAINNNVSVEQAEPVSAGGFDHQPSARSCVLLDVATLGVVLHTPVIVVPVLTQAAAHQQIAAGASWAQLFRACFSSRAPPLQH